jgi:hypothetical protein
MEKKMMYAETECRLKLIRNGLIEALAFANVHGFSEWPSGKIEKLNAGIGTGVRFRLNKKSDTNSAIDYGWGLNGSRGLFVYLGEVF